MELMCCTVGCMMACNSPIDNTLQKAVSAQSICPVDATGYFSGSKQPRYRLLLRTSFQHLRRLIDLQSAHAVVKRRRNIRDVEMVVFGERRRKRHLSEVVLAGIRCHLIRVDCFTEYANVNPQFGSYLIQAPNILDKSFEFVESNGTSSETLYHLQRSTHHARYRSQNAYMVHPKYVHVNTHQHFTDIIKANLCWLEPPVNH